MKDLLEFKKNKRLLFFTLTNEPHFLLKFTDLLTTMEITTFEQRIANYRKVGIEIEVLENKDGIPVVLIKQTRLINGFILNQKQLAARARKVFAPQKIHVKPTVFSLDTSMVTTNWIIEKMDIHGIKRNDLIKQLAIDKASLSKLLNGTVELSKRTKASFFYYFLTYDLNAMFRKNS